MKNLLLTTALLSILAFNLAVEMQEFKVEQVVEEVVVEVVEQKIIVEQHQPEQVEEIVEEPKEEPKIVTVSRGVPRKASGKFKSYMDFRTITNKSSAQYELQQKAYTSEDGLRMYDGYILVAMGTHYSESVGDKFIIHLSNGTSLNVMIGDIKADCHTDSTNRYIPFNGNIVEFIVDTKVLSKLCKKMGDVSYVESIDLSGHIIKIEEVVE